MAIVIVITLFILLFPVSGFRSYRRFRGGRWGKVTGLMWGSRWVRVTPECLDRIDEDYT